MIENSIHPGSRRLAEAVAAGQPIAGSPAQARELVTHENEAAAQAAKTDAWLARPRAAAVTNRCERADERGGTRTRPWSSWPPGLRSHGPADDPEREGSDVGRGSVSRDRPRRGCLGWRMSWAHHKGLRGEIPNDVEPDSRRGCCGRR